MGGNRRACSDTAGHKKKVTDVGAIHGQDFIQRMKSAALSFLQREEGFRATPYWDVRQWSIGYGTGISTDPKRPDRTVTVEEARELLSKRLFEVDLPVINQKLRTVVSEGLLIALLSFGYNLGMSIAVKMIERLNKGEALESLATTWEKYIFVAGVANKSLHARRLREIRLFLPNYQPKIKV